jgi:uncharacterized protein (TIGR02300 family)
VPTLGDFAFDRHKNSVVTDRTIGGAPNLAPFEPGPPLCNLHNEWGIALASDERGTKRTCPVTGRKFYDLNKDPVVSPYTGKSYPLSFFEAPPEKPASRYAEKKKEVEPEEVEEADIDTAAEAAGAEVISLNDAEDDNDDDDDDDSSETIPDVEDVEVDEELGGDDDDTFLESDDDEDDIEFDVDVDDEDER